MGTKCKFFIVIFFFLAFNVALTKVFQAIYKLTQPQDLIDLDLENWPQEENLAGVLGCVAEQGISSLASCGQLNQLPELPAHDEERLQRAARLLQQRLILRQWLTDHRLVDYYQRLLHVDVASLEDVYWLEDAQARSIVGKDFGAWTTARESLPTSKDDLESLKFDLWSAVVKNSQHEDAWTWGGMLVVSVSVAGLVTLAAMTQPSLAPEAKHSLLQYVTGKYLLPSNCKVNFDWVEPPVVGNTVSFTVRFYQRNWQPYPICDSDKLTVSVVSGNREFATAIQLGGTDPKDANLAVVKFTVRQAGTCTIDVKLGTDHVQGSPFTQVFLPGAPVPSKTVFLKHSSIVVCTAGVPYKLELEPRDEFDNPCLFSSDDDPTDGYDFNFKSVDNNTSSNKVCDFAFHWTESTRLPSPRSSNYSTKPPSIFLQVTFQVAGIYHTNITLRNVGIKHGEFDVIVLTPQDAATLKRNVETKNLEVCYEARLRGFQGDPSHKPKRVFCYISPKQLTIKEFVFKFIPRRLVTFRLCPSTKFLPIIESSWPSRQQDSWQNRSRGKPTFPGFNYTYYDYTKYCFFGESENPQPFWPAFAICDGRQPLVELASKDRHMIAATFAIFLSNNIGGSETFKDKRDFFYHQVRNYHKNHRHDAVYLRIHRDRLLETSMKVTKAYSVSDWCRNFKIHFVGESGLDWGGLHREWIDLVCAGLFDSRHGLFSSFTDGPQALVHPNPKRPTHLTLKHYEFAGKIVGKCLYESALGSQHRQLVRARFMRSFLAQIIGLRVRYQYLEQDDPDLYLRKVKYIEENDVDGMDLYFTEEEYSTNGKHLKTVDLIPNGSNVKVTNLTKKKYLDSLAQYRLSTNIIDEVEHFLKGLNDLIPDSLLSIFDENELELLICGTGEFNVADLRANHIADGGTVEFRRVLQWFWTSVSNFTHEQMARLLQFATGCSQLPPGGFVELNPKFRISASYAYNRLPTAHTCFNQVFLPDYETFEQFEKALLLAITEGSEGFNMV